MGHASTNVTEKVYRKELRPVLSRGATAMDALRANGQASYSEPMSQGRVPASVGFRTVSFLPLDGSLDSRKTGRMPLGWKLVIDSINARPGGLLGCGLGV